MKQVKVNEWSEEILLRIRRNKFRKRRQKMGQVRGGIRLRDDFRQAADFHVQRNTTVVLYHEFSCWASYEETIFNLWIFADVRYEVCAFQAAKYSSGCSTWASIGMKGS